MDMNGAGDPTGFFHSAWDAIKYAILFILGLLGWNVKRQISRVDKIEDNYVSTETLNNSVNALRSDIKGIHKRLDNFIDNRRS